MNTPASRLTRRTFLGGSGLGCLAVALPRLAVRHAQRLPFEVNGVLVVSPTS